MKRDDYQRRPLGILGALPSQNQAVPAPTPEGALSRLFASTPVRLSGIPTQNWGVPSPSTATSPLLAALRQQYRRRHEWKERFSHWERAESTSETTRIERARSMVKDALSRSAWLSAEGVRLAEQ